MSQDGSPINSPYQTFFSPTQSLHVGYEDLHKQHVGSNEVSKPLPDKDDVDDEGLNPKTSTPKIFSFTGSYQVRMV